MKKWVCCQLGARMHYAIPRLLHASGRLERLHTDIYGGGWANAAKIMPPSFLPAGLRRLTARAVVEIPPQCIRSYPAFGLAYFLRRRHTKNPETMDQAHLWAGQVFGNKVVRDGFGDAGAVYAFNTASLEILSSARRQGLFSVMEQTIVPRFIEEKLLAEAQQRYPGWEPERSANQIAGRLAEREQAEWQQADLIVCGSEFVRDGIGLCGGPVERCVVVPYGVDSRFTPGTKDSKDCDLKRPLRVLMAGQVGLRKGAGDALAVAKALREIAKFRWVGSISLLEPARSELAGQIDLPGIVPRNEIARHYQWADVFFLPSICEGSATVTYEALASGLPVVTTPNAGSVVQHGVDGFIAPVHDVAAMADYLRRFHEDRNLLARFSRAAALRAGDISLVGYQDRFLHQVAKAADQS